MMTSKILIKEELKKSTKNHKTTTLNKNKILIIEDNIDNLITLKTMLPSNLEIIVTTEGELALELAINHKPFIIFIDLALKNFSGLDLMKQIKLNSEIKETKIIILTESTLVNDIHNLHSESFDGYISKPIDVDFSTNYLKQFFH